MKETFVEEQKEAVQCNKLYDTVMHIYLMYSRSKNLTIFSLFALFLDKTCTQGHVLGVDEGVNVNTV